MARPDASRISRSRTGPRWRLAASIKPRRPKASLDRSILAQGWTVSPTNSPNKVQQGGYRVVTVDPGSPRRLACGVLDAGRRESRADLADVNAAMNILRRWNTAPLRAEKSSRRVDCFCPGVTHRDDPGQGIAHDC